MVQDRGDDDRKAAAGFRDWIGLRAVPDWARARWLGALLGVVFLLLCVSLVGLALAAGISSLVHSIGGAGAGGNLGTSALIAAIIGAPLVIWRTLVAQTTVNLQKEGLMTDRISKAVEQLGAEKTVKRRVPGGTDAEGKALPDSMIEETRPNIEVRIGGLYALERIAQDSMNYDKGRDHIRVMEIICAYVRENAPAKGAKQSPHEVFARLTADSERGKGLSAEEAFTHSDFRAVNNFARNPTQLNTHTLKQWSSQLPFPRTDIQTAVTILGRRTAAQLGLERFARAPGSLVGYQLDLRATNLQRSDLAHLQFRNMLLTGAHLEGANLAWAHLQGVSLREARLDGANLRGAHLERADLREAHFRLVDLREAHLDGANLRGAKLEGAGLGEAHLRGANLGWAHLEGANLWWAHLEGANFRGTSFSRSTSLLRATFRGARISKVDLSGILVEPDQIQSMFGDGSVTLPVGVTPSHPDWPKHWPQEKLDYEAFKTQWRAFQRSIGYIPAD